jgi:hypothetical protein
MSYMKEYQESYGMTKEDWELAEEVRKANEEIREGLEDE